MRVRSAPAGVVRPVAPKKSKRAETIEDCFFDLLGLVSYKAGGKKIFHDPVTRKTTANSAAARQAVMDLRGFVSVFLERNNLAWTFNRIIDDPLVAPEAKAAAYVFLVKCLWLEVCLGRESSQEKHFRLGALFLAKYYKRPAEVAALYAPREITLDGNFSEGIARVAFSLRSCFSWETIGFKPVPPDIRFTTAFQPSFLPVTYNNQHIDSFKEMMDKFATEREAISRL